MIDPLLLIMLVFVLRDGSSESVSINSVCYIVLIFSFFRSNSAIFSDLLLYVDR